MTKSEQARADALRRAEERMQQHDLECPCAFVVDDLGKWRRPSIPCCNLVDARAWGDVVKFQLQMGRDVEEYVVEAARAAFRAVPGLRGEESK